MQVVPIYNSTDSGCPNVLWCKQGVPIINGTYRMSQYLMELTTSNGTYIYLDEG